MGKKALKIRKSTKREIRSTPLSSTERAALQTCTYQGSPLHKRSPGDFGLTPPVSPRPDKTMCDEANVRRKADAERLFGIAVARGLVSADMHPDGVPKQLWAVDEHGQVFEGMYGGSGVYHGYPVRESDDLFDQVTEAWGRVDG